MKHDDKEISERFLNTDVVKFFKTISQDDIDEQFNPFQMREKWVKFFRGNMSRPTLNTDRVLKNTPDYN